MRERRPRREPFAHRGHARRGQTDFHIRICTFCRETRKGRGCATLLLCVGLTNSAVDLIMIAANPDKLDALLVAGVTLLIAVVHLLVIVQLYAGRP